ncbi:MAG TPA: Lrp/AsnC ligand binding domain-containing protein [Blastocatellia bacterium]|nr:Lrp/AsnC ligand binding domain-containing protein [Blastocatellia bacterium]
MISSSTQHRYAEPAGRPEPGVLAFVFVQTEAPSVEDDLEGRLIRLAEVEEVHRVAGEDCYVVKIRVPDVAGLEALLRERFYTLDSLRSIRTTLVLKTIKED